MPKDEKQSLITNQDLEKIYKVAELWQEKLSNKAIVLFYENENSAIKHETICFKDENFSHLVGCDRNRDAGVSAIDFYQKALNHNLQPWKDFTFANYKLADRVNFDLKMEVISQVFNIADKPLQTGVFNEMMFVDLTADKVVGHKNASLAIELDDMTYYPKSVLNQDFRTCVYAQTIAPVLMTAKYSLGKDALHCPLEITRLSNAVDKKRAEKIFQSLNDFNTKGVESSLFSGLKMNEDFEELLELSDYYKQKATKVLDVIAKENGWEHYSIVEDSSYFQDGLRVIGYDSEDAKLGLVDGGELGSECIDVLSLRYDLIISDKELDCTLDEFLKEHNIDNLEDVKTQDFIDAQGLSEEVHAPQRADASFAKPLKFSDIKTSADVKNWAQAVNEKMKSFVCNKDNPSFKMKNFVKQERNLFGEVDKYRDYPVVRWNDANVLADDARKVMREEFADVEHLECAMKVWMNYNNNPNMEINDLYLQQIQNNNVNGVFGYYLSQLPPQNEGEKVFYDNEVLQNLIDEEFIDEINQDATSRQFEILSDGEEIPFDVQQGQNDKSQEAKNKNKNLNKQKAQFRKNNYKRTDQWEESRTDRQKIKTPTELMEYATKRAAEVNSQNQKSQHQEREKKQSRSNNGFSR